VESPGTAPGSDPLITCAFISIVPERTSYRYATRAGFTRASFECVPSIQYPINPVIFRFTAS